MYKYYMNLKYLGVIFAILMMVSFTFAVDPDVSLSTPGTLLTGSSTILSISILDSNGEDTNAYPNELYLYYSTTSGGQENPIISDTNLNDGIGIICPDYNFSSAKICTYPWTVPQSTPVGFYYIDANLVVNPADTNWLGSSDNFKIEQTHGCVTLLWTMGIITLMLCFMVLMKFMGEGMPIKTMIALAVSAIIAIAVIIYFVGGVCVV